MPLIAPRARGRVWLTLLILVAVVGGGGVLAYRLLHYIEFTPPHREGPPALVSTGAEEPELWLMLKSEERRMLGPRGRGDRFGTRYLLLLQAHSTRTGERLWQRRLRIVDENAHGGTPRGRLLGQYGDLVWLFVHDMPVAVNAKDGAVKLTALDLMDRNPQLQGLWPTELTGYTFDRGLVVITADARRWRIDSPGGAVQPYTPEAPSESGSAENRFAQLRFMSSQWNGGWQTHQFVTPQVRLGDALWFGLYTAGEAREAGQDEFGELLKNPTHRWRGDDAQARRSFHTARIGRTRSFSEGSHPRVFDVTRLPGSPEYLQGGLLKRAGQPEAILRGTDALVLHRTRTDAAGRLQVTRLTLAPTPQPATPKWTAALPMGELHNRWQFDDRLLLTGNLEVTVDGRPRHHEALAVLELDTGTVRGWIVDTESPWPASAASSAPAQR